MSDAVLKKRNDQIESWMQKIQVGIYPEWRTVMMERQPELGDDDFELWEQEADYKGNRFGYSTKPTWKKAYVRLEQGQDIDFASVE